MDWGNALTEVAKASPFALMCIFVVWIVTASHTKNLRQISIGFDKSVDNIKQAYSDGMKLTRESMIALNEIHDGKYNKLVAGSQKR